MGVRGPQRRKDNLYPWGKRGRTGARRPLKPRGQRTTGGHLSIGSKSLGVQDLMGNVWEWTSSKASVYKGNPLQLPANYQTWIIARGGSYSSPANKLSGTMRDWFAPNYKNPVLGFRLVKVSS